MAETSSRAHRSGKTPSKGIAAAMITKLLIDSGSAFDLAPENCPGERAKRANLPALSIANGTVLPTIVAEAVVPELGEHCSFLNLEQTPYALSLGRRCVLHGYGFHWPAFSEHPALTLPNEETRQLTLENYVPVLEAELKPAPRQQEQATPRCRTARHRLRPCSRPL